ncbi:MAG: helix-turn-helix domain-containing protein [Thermoleophilia bacterium]|jgi:transcriptional regulator with XRE-family HTH domain
MAQDPWSTQVEALGRFIHAQRKMAKLSQRELAALSDISNAYLSQVERGLHQPSMRVINQVAKALGMPPEAFLTQAGMLDADEAEATDQPVGDSPRVSAEEAIRTDPSLTPAQREALLAVYRSFSAE